MANTLTLDVVDVTDGDTLVVEDRDGSAFNFRVWGIDAPETEQPYGPAATKAARQLIGGETVRLHVEDTGPYGRLIARVRTADVDLGKASPTAGTPGTAGSTPRRRR